MFYLNDVLICSIYLLFPIFIYYFYIAYNKKIENEENNIMLSLALFTAFYLMIKNCSNHFPRTCLLLLNIPIILAYVKKRPIDGILLSLMYIISANILFNINFYYIILEYILYFLLYIVFKNKKTNGYLFTTALFLMKAFLYLLRCNASNHFFDDSIYGDRLYISIPIAYITTLFLLYIVHLGDDIIKYHISYKKLVNEKQIRLSLFKITHEIKNPLAVCKGYLDMLDTNNKEQCAKYIPIIKEEIDHTLLILQDFSSFSKIDIVKEEIDINYLIDAVMYNHKELFRKHNITTEVYVSNELYINADYNRLMQVFINIIKNSIEALENIKDKKIIIKEKITKNYIYIYFIDNGCGIEKDVLSRIFEPFCTTKKCGTGLGVSLSNEIILAHNGNLKYDSLPGKGTTITIKLPKK